MDGLSSGHNNSKSFKCVWKPISTKWNFLTKKKKRTINVKWYQSRELETDILTFVAGIDWMHWQGLKYIQQFIHWFNFVAVVFVHIVYSNDNDNDNGNSDHNHGDDFVFIIFFIRFYSVLLFRFHFFFTGVRSYRESQWNEENKNWDID